MRKRRTRLMLTADTVGGVWQYALGLAQGLRAHGVDTMLALIGPPPSRDQRAEAKVAGATLIETGLALDWLAATPDALDGGGERIVALARETGADIVQINQPALAAGIEIPLPLVVVAHSCLATWWDAVEGGAPPADFAWRIERHAQGLGSADLLVTPSASFAAATQAAYGLGAPPHVVHNGRRPLVHPAAAMHDFAFTAGRLWDRGKNVATLDRAAARLGIPFKAAGAVEGPHGEIRHFEHLALLGRVGEQRIADCLAARPVFASAALYEPFGLAVLEAASAGCPLVLSDIPTFRELWNDVAWFVAPDDHAGFSMAIERLVGDTRLRLEQGERARAAARRFTLSAQASRMASLFGDLLRRHARAAA